MQGKISLLTIGTVLLLLGVAMPAAYAGTFFDPHVSGSGFGSYVAPALGDCTGDFATIAFDGSGGTIAAHGDWAIAIGGGSGSVSGTISSVSTTGPRSNPTGFSLTGTVTNSMSCARPVNGSTVTISGTCVSNGNIVFTGPDLKSFMGSGPVKCKG